MCSDDSLVDVYSEDSDDEDNDGPSSTLSALIDACQTQRSTREESMQAEGANCQALLQSIVVEVVADTAVPQATEQEESQQHSIQAIPVNANLPVHSTVEPVDPEDSFITAPEVTLVLDDLLPQDIEVCE